MALAAEGVMRAAVTVVYALGAVLYVLLRLLLLPFGYLVLVALLAACSPAPSCPDAAPLDAAAPADADDPCVCDWANNDACAQSWAAAHLAPGARTDLTCPTGMIHACRF